MFKVTNMREFKLDLSRFTNNAVPGAHLALQKRVAIEVLKRVVLKTPVDTGRARGNWQVGIDQTTDTAVDNFDQSGTATIAAGAAMIAGAQPKSNRIDRFSSFGVFWIYNNVEYILPLENGHSKQAPSGMVAVTLAEMEAFAR